MGLIQVQISQVHCSGTPPLGSKGSEMSIPTRGEALDSGLMGPEADCVMLELDRSCEGRLRLAGDCRGGGGESSGSSTRGETGLYSLSWKVRARETADTGVGRESGMTGDGAELLLPRSMSAGG